MKTYEVTYNENNHINKTERIDAGTIQEALVLFIQKKPNADYTEIVEVVE